MLWLWVVIVSICLLGLGFVTGSIAAVSKFESNYVIGELVISNDEMPYLNMDKSTQELDNDELIIIRVKKI